MERSYFFMTKPKAVLISDIHFTLTTLELAKKALTMAKDKAFELKVPLIICGDTLDNKAIMRAECVNALLDILSYTPYNYVETLILVGNHDLLNEKGAEHSLRFLDTHCCIVDKPIFNSSLELYLVPYIGDKILLQEVLSKIPKGSTIIMHQGVQSAYMGHYVQDKTSLPKESFEGYRVISGHYHKSQDIECGDSLYTYVGNPYTLSYGEALDGPKGFKLLNEDNSLTFIPTNLRKHIVLERTQYDLLDPVPDYNMGDLVHLKVTGSAIELENLDKNEVGKKLFGHSNFKFDKIAYDLPKTLASSTEKEKLNDSEMLDHIIDTTKESESIKTHLKSLWRELLNETTNGGSK